MTLSTGMLTEKFFVRSSLSLIEELKKFWATEKNDELSAKSLDMDSNLFGKSNTRRNKGPKIDPCRTSSRAILWALLLRP